MIGMTAFRAISHQFPCLAVRHDGSGNTTARRQDKANWRSLFARAAKSRQVSVCTLGFARQRRHQTGTIRGPRGAAALRLSADFNLESSTALALRYQQHRRLRACASIPAPQRSALAAMTCDAERALQIGLKMARDSDDDFRVHLGRSRSRAGRAGTRFRPFVKQVEAAIRKARGNPSLIGGQAGKRSGRFNARGRGARLSFPRDGAGWQRDSAGRFRARRVVVKARVVKLNPRRGARGPKLAAHASRAAEAHLRYLERDGVTRDGEKGHAYSGLEDEADSRAFLARGREDRHQFRFIVVAEDAADLGD